jgi:sortase B
MGLAYWQDLQTQQLEAEVLSELRSQIEVTSDPSPTPAESFQPEANLASVETSVPALPSQTLEIQANPHFQFLKRNSDYVGWIEINDTRIDYPIVRGQDNEYYLDHSFEQVKNSAGAIFMDYRNIGNGDDHHTLIYGHHMRNQSMFAELDQVLDPGFWSEHREFEVDYLFSQKRYRVFAAYETKADAYMVQTQFDPESFADYLTRVTDASVHQNDTEVTFVDKLLTLATCAYSTDDARLVVHAVLIP